MSRAATHPYWSRGFGVWAAVACGFGAGSISGEVWAQGAQPNPASPDTVNADQDASALNEIVVTAQFRSESLQTTPIAITAENATMMEARSQTSLLDVASAAPNVNIRPSTSALGNAASIYIRGVGQYDSSFALEPGVGIYIDDVYFPTIYGSVFDLLDLDRVEILRGPQGTLAGKNSIGGAIKLYTEKPNGENGGYVDVGYGDFNALNVRAGADFTVVPDELFVRIAGVYKRRDGYETRLDYGCVHPGSAVTPNPIQEGCTLGTEGGEDFGGVRAEVRWTPTRQLEVNFSADSTLDNGEPVPTKLVYALPSTGLQQYITPAKYVNYSTYSDATVGFSVPPINRVGSDGEALHINYELTDDLSLTSITAYRSYNGQSGIDGDGTPLGVQDIYSTDTFREITEEDRLSGKLGPLDYTLGAFYYHGNGDAGGRVDASGVDFLTGDKAISQSTSGFLHTVLHATDQLSLSAGVRYTHETKEYTFSSLSPFDPGQPTVTAETTPARVPTIA